jgi:cytochrome P450
MEGVRVDEGIAFGSVDAESVDPFEFKNQFFGGEIENFYPRMEEVQRACPVHQGSISGVFGLSGIDTLLATEDHQLSVLTYGEVEQVLKDPSTFSSTPLYDRTLRAPIGETILGMDPPGHRRFRELIQPAFTRKEMDRWEREFVLDIIDSYLTPLVGLGRADLATDFAFLYPIHVTAIAAGLPVDDFDVFYRDTALLTNVAISESQRLAAGERLGGLVRGLIAQRRAEPRQDLISALIRAEFKEAPHPAHQMLTDEEIVAFLRLLVPAGAQTTYRALTNLLCGLLTHDDQLEAVRTDRSLIPQAVEESLRWEVPLTMVFRAATGDGEIAGCPFVTDDVVNLSIGAANHDGTRWDDPHRFDIFRPAQLHHGFGSGPHTCLGIHMARMELRLAVTTLLDRLPNLRLDPDQPVPAPHGVIQRGTYHLPVVWDAP